MPESLKQTTPFRDSEFVREKWRLEREVIEEAKEWR